METIKKLGGKRTWYHDSAERDPDHVWEGESETGSDESEDEDGRTTRSTLSTLQAPAQREDDPHAPFARVRGPGLFVVPLAELDGGEQLEVEIAELDAVRQELLAHGHLQDSQRIYGKKACDTKQFEIGVWNCIPCNEPLENP